MSAKKNWDDLEPRTRRLIVVAGAIEGVLKIAALIDLARRPSNEVRGSKTGWAAAVVLVNALGAVPLAYFAWGRRRSSTPWDDQIADAPDGRPAGTTALRVRSGRYQWS